MEGKESLTHTRWCCWNSPCETRGSASLGGMSHCRAQVAAAADGGDAVADAAAAACDDVAALAAAGTAAPKVSG